MFKKTIAIGEMTPMIMETPMTGVGLPMAGFIGPAETASAPAAEAYPS